MLGSGVKLYNIACVWIRELIINSLMQDRGTEFDSILVNSYNVF